MPVGAARAYLRDLPELHLFDDGSREAARTSTRSSRASVEPPGSSR